jgi:phage terminase small subunit
MKKLPKAPAHLSREAKTWWKKVVEGWLLDDPSLLILQSGLEALDRMREAQETVKKEGAYIKDRFGQLRPHQRSRSSATPRACCCAT